MQNRQVSRVKIGSDKSIIFSKNGSHSGSMSAAQAAENGQNRPKSGPATLSDRCSRRTPGRPPAGSEAPARALPSLVSTLGGQSGDLVPREVGARLLRAGGACCGQEPHPGAPTRQPRTDGPLPPYSPRRRAQITPPRSSGAGAATPRPRRRSGAALHPARGRCPLRRPPKAAKTGQNGPRNGSDRCPKETPGHPPAQSEARPRGHLVPLSMLGGSYGQLAPRELGARLLPVNGLYCAYNGL
jgi:hypothetical protein